MVVRMLDGSTPESYLQNCCYVGGGLDGSTPESYLQNCCYVRGRSILAAVVVTIAAA